MKNRNIPKIAGRTYVCMFSLVAGTLFFAINVSYGCDACNLSFADDIISGERSESVIAEDLRRAMQKQAGLPLEGYTNPQLAEMQLAKLEQAGYGKGEGVAASPAALSASAALAGSLMGATSPTRTSSAAAARVLPDYMKESPFLEILERDYALPTTPYSTVPQDAPVDKSFTIRLYEGSVYLGNGVVYEGFLMNGTIPGPTIVVDEGDVVEMIFENTGTIPHGASIHSAYTQTSKYVGKIPAKGTQSVRFRVMTPGVYMYHCAPGGHAIPMHVLAGQYGMMVVRPKPGSYRLEKELGHPPDLELFLVQNELYASGKDAIDGRVSYAMFNGKLFRYVEEPIVVKPGDYVRINYLNVGPNLLSTFHIVGILWDYVYWQGNPDVILPGGQTVTAGPSDSFVIEFRMPPDEGAYTMLNHAVGATSRGAIGLLVVDASAELEPNRVILADGPSYSEAEMEAYKAKATRVVAPFGIGTSPADRPVVYGPEVKEVHVSIIGNSFHPKVIQVAPGTKVVWTNEDVFTYMSGEYSGIHNVASTSAPEDSDGFVAPLLAHGESFSHVFEDEWEYDYICTPHPYMRGRVIVKQPEYTLAGVGGGAGVRLDGWMLPLLALCLILSSAAFVLRRKS